MIYARVSSIAQRDRDTIASQLRSLPEFASARGWDLVEPADRYVDDGFTARAGKLAARRGLADLLRDAAAGRFDVVVVADIDRLTRSEDLGERGAILGALQRAGVRVASAASGQVLDLSTSTGDLFSTLAAFFAAEDNRKRAERIRQGKITAIARGRKPSGPTPYGWRYDRASGAWSLDPDRAPIVREIYERVAAGESCVVIADDLHARGAPPPRTPWRRHKVWQIARARTGVGEWHADRARGLTIAVPAIVEEAAWQAAQAALVAHGKRGLRRTRHVYLLEGLATCARCGSPVLIRSPTKQRRGLVQAAAYVCRDRKLAHRARERCAAPIVRTADLDARVWAAVCRELEDPELIAWILAEPAAAAPDREAWERDDRAARAHLARLDQVEAAILARFRRQQIGEAALDQELAAIARERSAVQRQIAAAGRATHQIEARRERQEHARATVDRLRRALPTASAEDRRDLLAALVPRGGAVLKEGRLRITLAIAPEPAAEQALAVGSDCSPAPREQSINVLRIRLVA